MSYLPHGFGRLQLNVHRPNWRNEINLHRTPKYLSILHSGRKNTAQAACHFCGYPDGEFLEIHHVNGDHDDYSDGNIKYACSLCHRLHHLGWAGIKSNGKLIHLPSWQTIGQQGKAQHEVHSLEVFNIMQRFVIMSKFLSQDEQERFQASALMESISSLLACFKHVDLQSAYIANKYRIAKILQNQREIETKTPEEKAAALKKQKEERLAEQLQDDSDVFNTEKLNIIDLVDALCQVHQHHLLTSHDPKQPSPTDTFFAQQTTGEFGRLTLFYNESIFEPFEPNPAYSLEERLQSYRDSNMFTKDGLTKILHVSRQGRQASHQAIS